jgi:tetratricopeptide (TPR) repeat protein
MGEVAEAFAGAWRAAGEMDKAMEWYERALTASDGTASLKASEQLANLRVRVAEETVSEVVDRRNQIVNSLSTAPDRTSPKRGSRARKVKDPKLAEVNRELSKAIAAGRKSIDAVIDLLQRVLTFGPTMERSNLLGSAYKRLALIESAAEDARREKVALLEMKKHYEQAEALSRQQQAPDLFYPALNQMAADIALNRGGPEWKRFDRAMIAQVQQSLANKVREDPDFWSVVGMNELMLYQALDEGNLSVQVDPLIAEYERLHSRVSASRMWSSVYDTARFVLYKYMAAASPAEKAAAQEVLNKLRTLAKGTPGG